MENLHINVNRDITGEKFKEVHVSGSGRFMNGLICDEIHISGKSEVNGDFITNDVHISGRLSVKGETKILNSMQASGTFKGEQKIEVRECHVSGGLTANEGIQGESLHVSGALTAEQLVVEDVSVSGKITLQGALTAQTVQVSGKCTINNGIQAENVSIRGKIQVKGIINAECVELEAKTGSTFEGIGATKVCIQSHAIFPFPFLRKITGDHIEADEIYVEHADIKKISGQQVEIGPGCEIDIVEYMDSLSIDPASTVKQQIKI